MRGKRETSCSSSGGDCRRTVNHQPVGSCPYCNASGAIKQNRSPANAAEDIRCRFRRCGHDSVPAIREMNCPASAVCRAHGAITVATPGGIPRKRDKDSRPAPAAARQWRVASVHRKDKMASKTGWRCRRSSVCGSRERVRLRCCTKLRCRDQAARSRSSTVNRYQACFPTSHCGGISRKQPASGPQVPLRAANAAASKPAGHQISHDRNSRPRRL